MKVYIAGSSKEITRAERWGSELRAYDIEVVSTWPEVIRKVGKANPADATIAQYREWAKRDLDEVKRANVFWLLLPEGDTIGAWVELGHAHANDKMIVMSGAHRPIFTPALCHFHSHYDAEVAAYLRRISHQPFEI